MPVRLWARVAVLDRGGPREVGRTWTRGGPYCVLVLLEPPLGLLLDELPEVLPDVPLG